MGPWGDTGAAFGDTSFSDSAFIDTGAALVVAFDDKDEALGDAEVALGDAEVIFG